MEGGCVKAHNAFCHVVDSKCAGENGTEWRNELWSCAGCMCLCSEWLSREQGNAEEAGMSLAGAGQLS